MAHAFYFFPGDYLRDTLHLGWLEDCAYRRLLDLYYTTGKPIKNDRAYIMRAVRASEPEHQAAVDAVLTDFFALEADGWHQRKADREIQRANEFSAVQRRKAIRRWHPDDAMPGQCRGNARAMPGHDAVRDAGAMPTVNRKPSPSPKPSPIPKTENQKQGRANALPNWLPLPAWQAWLEVRTKIKAPNTGAALSLNLRKLERLREEGQSPEAVLEQSTERGWRGLFAVRPEAGGGKQAALEARNAEVARRFVENGDEGK